MPEQTNQATTAQLEQTATWQLDPAHTLVEFSAKHMMVTNVKGRFAGFRGTIVWNEADISKSNVSVEIDAASLDTRTEQRDQHLRSADFLHVEQHPTITFVSTGVEPVGQDHYRVVGDLTIRGTTKSVTLDTTFNGKGVSPYGKQVAGFSAETTISRKNWGLTYNMALEAGGVLVGDTIKIAIEAEAVKEG